MGMIMMKKGEEVKIYEAEPSSGDKKWATFIDRSLINNLLDRRRGSCGVFSFFTSSSKLCWMFGRNLKSV